MGCSNFRGIKLLSHVLKLWERIVETGIWQLVKFSDRQYSFYKGKNTAQPIFCLQMLQEKIMEYQTDFPMVFLDLEKMDETMIRELIGHCLRGSRFQRSMSRIGMSYLQHHTE